jgi:hypothetical protein
VAKEEKRAHKATYAADKKKGGYLVRVQGPRAADFVGRSVPVTVKSGAEHVEKLTRLIWTGTDDGEISGYVGPCALYAFEAKPKDKTEEIPF